jgi:D-arginine dehydrogenase
MTYDAIILGGGMAGASMAYELARSARVCLVERESQPGLHATGRSAALFAPSYGGEVIRALTRASRAFFDTPPPGFSEHPLLTARGCLFIARADQERRLSRMIDDVERTGGALQALDEATARSMVALLRPGHVSAAGFDAVAKDIDVDALHQGFLRGARARGAVVCADAGTPRATSRGGAWTVELPGSTITAPLLVNAAGAWADDVAAGCGLRPLGLRPLRRTALLVDPPADVDVRAWPAVIDVDERFYFKPESGKLLLSPADETPSLPCDAMADELDIAIAVDRVQGALDIDVRRITRSWAGLRTFAPDRVPVVGFDARAPGFFWCAGQGGYGIQTAPALARAAAAMALGDRLADDLLAEGLAVTALSPERFGAFADAADRPAE